MGMADALKERLDRIRSYSDSAKRRASLYYDISKIDGKNTARSLDALQRAPAPGKKLLKIGFSMLWVPEPTGVTCAIGGPMILAGRYLEKRYNGATISDIAHSTNSTTSEIHDFKKSIM